MSCWYRLAFLVTASSLVLACGEDDTTTAGEDDSSSSGGDVSTGADVPTGDDSDATTTGEPTTSGGSVGESLGTTTELTGDATTTSSTGTPDEDSTTGDDEDTTTGASEWDGDPLPPNPPGSWMWVEIPGSKCRHDSDTGIGVRYGTSDDLVIFFEGGGACFNVATCLLNEGFSSFGPLQFDAWKLGIGQGGIFDLDADDNPVADWNFIYVPYCTGDVHAGDKDNAGVPGVIGAQQFVGYRNVANALEQIVPTFATASHVVVTGQSAGGFGAAFNYDRIAEAWPKAKVTLLDDSGPPFADMYLAPCLQATWRNLWNLNDTIPADCDACFGGDGGGISNLAPYLAEKFPDQHFGLISSLRDTVIRTFFGYGLNNCAGGIYTGPMFEAGLDDLRTDVLGDDPSWASFLISGSSHTFIAGPSYYNTTVNGTRMVEWLADLLTGNTTHIAP